MILHIGLGKTGTTTLQSHVFPELVTKGLLAQYNPGSIMMPLMRYETLGVCQESLKEDISRLPDNSLISLESLIGWNPAIWELNFQRVKSLFPSNTRLLITLRDPESYLTSVYVQMLHQGMIVKPENFFLSKNQYQLMEPICRANLCEIFSVDELNYAQLVAMYSSHFKEVYVVSYASVNKLYFLRDLLKLPEATRVELAQKLTTVKRENVSYSAAAIKLTFLRERVFRKLGARTHSSQDAAVLSACKFSKRLEIGGVLDLPAVQQTRERRVRMSWRNIMQHGVSRFFPYKKYELPRDVSRGQHFQENRNYYNSIASQEFGYLRTTQ